MASSGLTVDDHGWITGDDHRGAVPFLGTGHLIAHTRNAFAVRIAQP